MDTICSERLDKYDGRKIYIFLKLIGMLNKPTPDIVIREVLTPKRKFLTRSITVSDDGKCFDYLPFFIYYFNCKVIVEILLLLDCIYMHIIRWRRKMSTCGSAT